ncbi:MAG: MotA/TolQ/ExbB proton channel family protein, partial [Rhodoferax sp.]|nr:MotA/TolQ/ExbB proton channel family protein [Rhodoferax sp.]
MNLAQVLLQGDAVSTAVVLLLSAMSVGSWVVILWKSWLLRRASHDVLRCMAAFWQSASVEVALQQFQAFDREALLTPMVLATQVESPGTLAAAGDRAQQLTRVLRDALHGSLA